MINDGKIFYGMAVSGANALANRQEEVNQLNVFPVPDGDTGLNMSMTLGNIESMVNDGDTVGVAAETVANSVLRAARGNSGAILSLFFRGMSKALKDLETADAPEIAAAFRKGTEQAYKAVMKPAEGTILTVMRRAAEEVTAKCDSFVGDARALFAYALEVAQKTLDETPEMLPVA